jgi:hypothetical protein
MGKEADVWAQVGWRLEKKLMCGTRSQDHSWY